MPSSPLLYRLSYRDSQYTHIYVQVCFPHKAHIRLRLLYCLSENRTSIYCNNSEIYYNCKFTSWRRCSIILLGWMQRRRDEKRGWREIYMRVFLIRKRQETAILTRAVVICSVYVLLWGSAPHLNETKAGTVVLGGMGGRGCLQTLMWSSLRRRKCTLAHIQPPSFIIFENYMWRFLSVIQFLCWS